MSKLKQYNFDQIAPYYDVLELGNTNENRKQNLFLYSLLSKRSVQSVLDMGCGTGVQSIFLKKKGLSVCGVDPSQGLLNSAKKKAGKLDIEFIQGDMRETVLGRFDAVISMYNSIGHVTLDEFKEQVLDTVKKNLNPEGLFIFDIFNFDFFKKYEGPESHDEEYHAPDGATIYRYTENDVRLSTQTVHVEHRNEIIKPGGQVIEVNDSWDMQLYTIEFLEQSLEKKGFEVVAVFGSQDGEMFMQEASPTILILARKNHNF